ncbi:C45 family autoproteolytic acyltransferase/hydolase [Inquilinus sp.]|jgi:hypothetical protein|uniref:C45 family autoproteolytic acyltransferase/hydolase n=1 Tax=Inquilinus sp. TaxID=1932117 RepID=UPI0037833D93
MPADTKPQIPVLEIKGTHHDIGVQLARFSADFFHGTMVGGETWNRVMAFRNDPRVAIMREMVEKQFPLYWQEIRGLADGLALPFDDMVLWHFRGDVWEMTPEGCTTVQIPGPEPIVAHNEDGDPQHRGQCALARVRPSDGGEAFTSFIYPGTIPGHAFAATDAGLVATINHIAALKTGVGMPRILLGRALLDCTTLDAAVRLLETSDRAGAYHVTLAQRGDPRIFGVEFTHSGCSVRLIEQTQCHTNHLIHRGMADEPQEASASSHARLRCGDRIVADKARDGRLDPLSVLWDKSDPALPICREDPADDSCTVAAAVFHVGARSLRWSVYDRAGAPPCYSGELG